MPLARLWTDERGSASLEFVSAAMILLVPLVYLVLTMSALQGGSLAVEGAARHAARVFVEADTPGEAEDAATAAVAVALADHGIDADRAEVSIRCSPDPARCLDRRATVTVEVVVHVPLPLVPPALGVEAPFDVPVASSATQRVSRFQDVP
ncbi:hypothetical protein CLV46_0950 [Diaminobutyricimonas aerilata]|uniref:TadE-like protein n=1 Tax=Diaminobutyricimonas aerilata TaxID=1162967 RepID=A0A2M9CHL4_9MICO|nr:hypothetical protein [Diaminobutyricimonas aerilata]PJJ71404.1 hypothetical protein CLV46_0950 [Diaminobutyricimonas aerilata]